jgi:P27 family predicted phage terminase small subunit
MIGGRNLKPVEQKMREGGEAVQHRAMPEPMLVAGRPGPEDMREPPETLPADGKEAWNAVVPQLADVGLLDRVDRLVLEAMCIHWARAKQAGKVIGRQGHLVRGPGGHIREHPSLRTERESFTAFMRIAEQFALTPVARTRLGLAELHRRTLKAEFEDALGEPELTPVEDAEVVEES